MVPRPVVYEIGQNTSSLELVSMHDFEKPINWKLMGEQAPCYYARGVMRNCNHTGLPYKGKSMMKDLLAGKSQPITDLQHMLLKEEEFSNTMLHAE